MKVGANYVLSLKTCVADARRHHDSVDSCKCWFPMLLKIICQLRQFVHVLVCKIFQDSQEIVWPEHKQYSAKADLCKCLLQTDLHRKISVHDSHHPVTHRGLLADHAKTVPSSGDQRSKEMKHETAALMTNGYPKHFVIDISKPKRPSQQMPATAPDDKKVSAFYCTSRVYKLKFQSCFKTTSNHWQFVSQTQRPSPKISDPWHNLFNLLPSCD